MLWLRVADGKVIWSKLLDVRGEDGDVALVEATPKDYYEKGRGTQPDRSKRCAWSFPVIANGKLYLRDQDVLLSYGISAR